MAEYDIRITDSAERDILEIARYISSELYAAEAALKLVDEIAAAISALSSIPQKYAYVLDERLRKLGYRKINLKNYIIFFCIDEDTRSVTVERVLYGRRDWLRIL